MAHPTGARDNGCSMQLTTQSIMMPYLVARLLAVDLSRSNPRIKISVSKERYIGSYRSTKKTKTNRQSTTFLQRGRVESTMGKYVQVSPRRQGNELTVQRSTAMDIVGCILFFQLDFVLTSNSILSLSLYQMPSIINHHIFHKYDELLTSPSILMIS